MNRISKSELKKVLVECIEKEISSTTYKPHHQLMKRVNHICRACINRLSYKLNYDSMSGKISLIREDGKEIIIEAKSRDLNLSSKAYEYVKQFMNIITTKLNEQVKAVSQIRLYVLIDSQYDESYRAVQAGHAVAAFMLKYPESKWKNSYLIYLKVDNLKEWKDKLDFLNRDYAYFIEPDVGNKMTAIAIIDSGKLFKKCDLN